MFATVFMELVPRLGSGGLAMKLPVYNSKYGVWTAECVASLQAAASKHCCRFALGKRVFYKNLFSLCGLCCGCLR